MDDWLTRLMAVLPPGMTVETAALILKAEFRLTQRECDIAVHLLIDGTDEDIAERLGGSPHTIKHHRGEIIAKIGVGGCRPAAVRISTCLWGKALAQKGVVA
jgi:DNA-binding CsgD family transcriptional regulator